MDRHDRIAGVCKGCFFEDSGDMCECGGEIHNEFEEEFYEEDVGTTLLIRYTCNKCLENHRLRKPDFRSQS